MNTYSKGDLVRVTGVFKNAAGSAFDPATVRYKFKTPTGTVTTYIYGTDAQLVKDAVGNYHVDIDADMVGVYYDRWEAVGTGKSAVEGGFTVSESQF